MEDKRRMQISGRETMGKRQEETSAISKRLPRSWFAISIGMKIKRTF